MVRRIVRSRSRPTSAGRQSAGSGPRCDYPVQPKIARSGLRLRLVLRSPDLRCESLPGSGRVWSENVVRDGAGSRGRSSLGWQAPGRLEVEFVTEEGAARCVMLAEARGWPFGRSLPVRRFAARKGQRGLSGLWCSATTGRYVGFGSWNGIT